MKKKISRMVYRVFPQLWGFYQQRKRQRLYRNKSPEAVFEYIYQHNVWGDPESVSGAGSSLAETEAMRGRLLETVKNQGIRSIADIPCGDFNWMKEVAGKFDQYTGGDIVESLVVRNKTQYATDRITFRKINLLSDPVPECDLLLVRDCFVHFSFEDIRLALGNILQSRITWLLTTHFPGSENVNIITGEWRPLNLCAAPFQFPEPFLKIHDGPVILGKYLALWRLTELEKGLFKASKTDSANNS